MKKTILFLASMCFSHVFYAQEVVQLPYVNSNQVVWETSEKAYYSELWGTEVITNIQSPSLLVFQPSKELRNGTSVVVAPGGGLYANSITSEGHAVAKWLVKKGITVFVLKYRLMPTGSEGISESRNLRNKTPEIFREKVNKITPLAVNDALTAMSYVRSHAQEYDIDPNKIGFIGFSAGGSLSMGLAYNCTEKNRPDFITFVYPWMLPMPIQKPKKNAPPALIICASNDSESITKGSIELYKSWYDEGLSVGLHMYSKGSHGFGMRNKGLASDTWIERFYDWMLVEGFVKQ